MVANQYVEALPPEVLDALAARKARRMHVRYDGIVALALEIAADGPLKSSRTHAPRTLIRRELLDQLRGELTRAALPWETLLAVRRAEELET